MAISDFDWVLNELHHTTDQERLELLTECIAADVLSGAFSQPYAAEMLRAGIRRQRGMIESMLTPAPAPDTT